MMSIKSRRNTLLICSAITAGTVLYLHGDTSVLLDLAFLQSIKDKFAQVVPGSNTLVDPPKVDAPNIPGLNQAAVTISGDKTKVISQVVNKSLEGVFAINANGEIGSGWSISQDLVVTNKHVVMGNSTVELTNFGNNKRCKGTVIHQSEDNDIAFVKHDCPCKTLGLSGFQRDQLIVSIGNPFGLGINISVGKIVDVIPSIRYKGRAVSQLTNVIAHNSLINPGNSGGPLLNETGMVVGMNSASGGVGKAIAIPVAQVEAELKKIK
ncbi:trypsin-like serine protease with C-terminal PDZ domain [Leptolyngbyaceae cyanobacterium JSC-12]|nr:trypsin-like serine protease with C-terminal PDZ domain [Leptolyngbyaceae cyanobacterium JSC-12]